MWLIQSHIYDSEEGATVSPNLVHGPVYCENPVVYFMVIHHDT